ncbi:hypothetical protein NKF06_07310 [Haloferax sp. AB510]|uniref:hypothetical protein n=1 Tax=Haloferax sp. AB510 TaxID=2934172 RepID=UPI00209BD67E|nr:hypothetical protein [Haloferax sp. AB510]MCO8266395.1 hypothetical protein [Haloferax sp. AB510]
MSQIDWTALLLVGGAFLVGAVGFLLLGPVGFFIGLVGTIFVGFPLKSAYENYQSRMAALEERVAKTESTVEQLKIDNSPDGDE